MSSENSTICKMFAFRDFSWIPRVINFLFIVIVLPILFDMYCIVNFLSHCRHFCHIVGIFAIQSLLLPHSRHFCHKVGMFATEFLLYFVVIFVTKSAFLHSFRLFSPFFAIVLAYFCHIFSPFLLPDCCRPTALRQLWQLPDATAAAAPPSGCSTYATWLSYPLATD